MKGSLREGAPAQAGEGEGENVIVHADFALSQAPSVTRKGSCHLPLGGRLCSRELPLNKNLKPINPKNKHSFHKKGHLRESLV